MENNEYNELKKSFKIVYEDERYIVLNDGKVFEKYSNNNLKLLSEDNKNVRFFRGLMKRYSEGKLQDRYYGDDLEIN